MHGCQFFARFDRHAGRAYRRAGVVFGGLFAAGHPASDSGREATRRLRRAAWLAAASLDGGRPRERALRAVVAAVREVGK
jgi:hypothetical protein